MTDLSKIPTSKAKTKLPSNLLKKLPCSLSLHKRENIYTRYFSDYGIAWDQYCLYCDAERRNPLVEPWG